MVELMMVVVVLGLLSSVALFSFRRYIVRSRVSEAYTMLAEIRIRESQYRAEFGQYCATPMHPATVPGETPVAWGAPPAAWVQLGARPDGNTRFQFEVIAGAPGVAVPAGITWNPATPNDFWYVAHAQADLDGDGIPSQFETYSISRNVWVNPGDGTFEYEAQ